MRLRCVPTRATIQARGTNGLTSGMRAHVESCTGCAEAIGDARVLDDAFADARAFEYTAPADTEQRVLAAIGPWAVPDPSPAARTGKIATVAALATAATTAAVGTVVIVLRRRHRAA